MQWGEHIHLIALANAYRRPIRVWTSGSDTPGWHAPRNPDPAKLPFDVAHEFERHYLSVLPQPTATHDDLGGMHADSLAGGRAGVGMRGWRPLGDGVGMDVDSVTDMAGADDGARSGVGGLASGQGLRLWEASAGVSLSGGAAGSALQGAKLTESGAVEMVAGDVPDHAAAVLGAGFGASDGAWSGIGELDSSQPERRPAVGAGAGPSKARLAATGAAPPRRSPARARRVDSAQGGLQDVAAEVGSSSEGPGSRQEAAQSVLNNRHRRNLRRKQRRRSAQQAPFSPRAAP